MAIKPFYIALPLALLGGALVLDAARAQQAPNLVLQDELVSATSYERPLEPQAIAADTGGHVGRQLALAAESLATAQADVRTAQHAVPRSLCVAPDDAAAWDGRRGWARVEYLLWWSEGQSIPALVTTSPFLTPLGQAGVLPGADILLGNERINQEDRSGGRITFGRWFDSCEECGIGVRAFGLGDGTERFRYASPGDPILARPFFNARSGLEDAALVAIDDPLIAQNGTIRVGTSSEVFGGDAFFRRLMRGGDCFRFDLLLGYQFSRIDEDLTIRENFTVTRHPVVTANTTLDVVDDFSTQNTFHGGELGVLVELYDGPWSLEVIGKVGLGDIRQEVSIRGRTIVADPVLPAVTSQGGLLAQPTNIGDYEQDDFAAVPELGVTLSYSLSDCLDFTVGYSLIYWSDIVRPSNHIDRSLNIPQGPGGPLLGGPVRPVFPGFHTTDYWVQGINFGLGLSY